MKSTLYIVHFLFLLSVNLFGQGIEEYKRGVALATKEKYQESLSFFSQAIEQNKNNHNYFIQRGLAHYELDQVDDAIQDFSQANSLIAGSASYLLARCYAVKGNLEMTLTCLEQNLTGKNKILYSEIVKERVFYDFLEYPKWIDFWEKEWYDDYQKILNEAGFMMNLADFYDAIEYIDKAISEKNKGFELYALRAKCYEGLKSYANAIGDYSLALEMKPKAFEYYNRRAVLYIETDKPKKAIDDFRQSISIDNTQIDLYYKLAILENSEELYGEALKSIQTYITYNPDDMDGLYLGGVIYRNNGEYLKALEYLNRLLDINPSKAEYFQARGETYLAISNDYLKYAINDFSMALDLKPNDPNTYIKRAEANYRSRKYDEACFDVNQAVKLGSLEALTMQDTYCAGRK